MFINLTFLKDKFKFQEIKRDTLIWRNKFQKRNQLRKHWCWFRGTDFHVSLQPIRFWFCFMIFQNELTRLGKWLKIWEFRSFTNIIILQCPFYTICQNEIIAWVPHFPGELTLLPSGIPHVPKSNRSSTGGRLFCTGLINLAETWQCCTESAAAAADLDEQQQITSLLIPFKLRRYSFGSAVHLNTNCRKLQRCQLQK